MIEDITRSRNNNNQSTRYLPRENGQHTSTLLYTEDSIQNNNNNQDAQNQLNAASLKLLSSVQPIFRVEQDADEASSSQSRDKIPNPFTINNDSSVVDFSAHLQRAKSLFTNRSYVSSRLKNYRMRNPRSSLYRSTSSLCDNNSVSSNASSAMSSPFYSGQTTFGGASAISRRLNSAFQPDLQLHNSKHHISFVFDLLYYYFSCAE